MKKNGFFAEFRKFIMRGNVIDMAVGVVVGGAFSKIVSSLVADIVTPLISLLTGKASFTELKWVLREAEIEVVDGVENIITPATTVNYGTFIQYIIDFILVAFSIFIVIKAIAKLRETGDKIKETPEMIAAKKAEEDKAAAEKAEADAKAAKEAEEIVAARRAQAETAELLRDIKALIEKK
ncbi:MAG: large conductance mechanosensitive channel protein MscL [Clostridia bacterium]|nr:large conductance mechanosensitive channel protein MscL [Clostridia bacterium]